MLTTATDGSTRRATPADLERLVALEAAFPSDRIGRRSMRLLLSRPSAEVWVHAPGGVVVADLVLLFRARTRVARVYSVVVAEAHRGRGLGVRLYELAAERARARGCRAIDLEVRVDNVAGLRLARRAGYRELCALPGYYEDGADGVRMRREL